MVIRFEGPAFPCPSVAPTEKRKQIDGHSGKRPHLGRLDLLIHSSRSSLGHPIDERKHITKLNRVFQARFASACEVGPQFSPLQLEQE